MTDGSRGMPLGRQLRHLVASAVWRVRPSLFVHVVERQARRGVVVREAGGLIDIMRPAERQLVRIARANALYLPLIAESFAYFFDSAEPVPIRLSGKMYDLVDFSTPRLHRVAGFDDFAVLFPSLTEPFVTTGQYCDFAELRAGSVAFDLGAYAALSSIAFSKAVGPEGRVIALEPDPLNQPAARANLAAHARVNGLDNVELVAAAAADKSGRLAFSSEGAMGSALVSIIGRHRGETVDVEAVTLQELADRFALTRVDFIKVDIEGSELPLVLGSEPFLRRYKPRLIIEPHFIDGTLTSGPIVSFLDSIDYHCEVIEQIGLQSLPLITAVPKF